jgi:hypothetical protein
MNTGLCPALVKPAFIGSGLAGDAPAPGMTTFMHFTATRYTPREGDPLILAIVLIVGAASLLTASRGPVRRNERPET